MAWSTSTSTCAANLPEDRVAIQRLHAPGSLWMLAAGALFALMGLCVKLGAQWFSQTELVFYRSLLGLLVLLPWLAMYRLDPRSTYWVAHVWRGLFGGVALWLYFYAITHLPLATAVSLNYTSPLFLALLGGARLGERLSGRLILALLVGFFGVLVLLRPEMTGGHTLAALAGLLSGLLASLAYLQVRQLGLYGEPEWRVVFWFSCSVSVAAGTLAGFDGLRPVEPSALPVLVGLGLTATLAQLAMTRAYRVGRPLVVGALAYSTLLFSACASAIWLNEVPSLDSVFGMVLIFAAGLLSLLSRPRQRDPASATQETSA